MRSKNHLKPRRRILTSAQVDLVRIQSSPLHNIPYGLQFQYPKNDDEQQYDTSEER